MKWEDFNAHHTDLRRARACLGLRPGLCAIGRNHDLELERRRLVAEGHGRWLQQAIPRREGHGRGSRQPADLRQDAGRMRCRRRWFARHSFDRKSRIRNLLEPVPGLLRRSEDAGLHGRDRRQVPRLQAHGTRGRRQGLCDAMGFRPGRHVLPPRLLREGRHRPGNDQDLGRFHRGRQEASGSQSRRHHDPGRHKRRHRILPDDRQ